VYFLSTEEEGSIMPPQPRIALAIVVFALVCTVSVSIADTQQKPLTADQRQIVDTVSAIFAAARTDGVAKFDSVIASWPRRAPIAEDEQQPNRDAAL
jgi:hypothetical protein